MSKGWGDRFSSNSSHFSEQKRFSTYLNEENRANSLLFRGINSTRFRARKHDSKLDEERNALLNKTASDEETKQV